MDGKLARTASADRRHLGRLFDEEPEFYDRVRPTYPDELMADRVAITGMSEQSRVLEVASASGKRRARWRRSDAR